MICQDLLLRVAEKAVHNVTGGKNGLKNDSKSSLTKIKPPGKPIPTTHQSASLSLYKQQHNRTGKIVISHIW